MGRLLIVMLLLNSSISFAQQLGYMRDFVKVDENSYMMSLNTEEEAVKMHQKIMDLNGMDTTFTMYEWGNNPVVFSYFKLDANSDEVVVTFIFPHKNTFDIWFIEINDEDTYFIDVIDKNGETVELRYRKP